jgi:molybdopterin synthase sulfur carrier subunit
MNVSFSGTLLRFVDFQKTVSVEAESVEQALRSVTHLYPNSASVLYDSEGKLRQVHQIFLNGKQIRPDQVRQAVSPNDRLDILTAIAGG